MINFIVWNERGTENILKTLTKNFFFHFDLRSCPNWSIHFIIGHRTKNLSSIIFISISTSFLLVYIMGVLVIACFYKECDPFIVSVQADMFSLAFFIKNVQQSWSQAITIGYFSHLIYILFFYQICFYYLLLYPYTWSYYILNTPFSHCGI